MRSAGAEHGTLRTLELNSPEAKNGRGCVKTTALAISALEFGEKCSLTACQLRFLAEFRLDLAALVTFLHSLGHSQTPSNESIIWYRVNYLIIQM